MIWTSVMKELKMAKNSRSINLLLTETLLINTTLESFLKNKTFLGSKDYIYQSPFTI